MTNAISASNLKMRFSGCDALQGVDLQVPTGSVFALLGENGAGKTTLIKILTGFQRPTSGSCTICGLDPAKDALEIRRRVGYVSDAPALYDWMRVDEIGWFAASFYDDQFLSNYRQSIERYELPASRKIRNLSKGQRAKVALALAVAHDPELLILDEPTSGLDPHVRREFLESMVDRAAAGRTVLLSSHQISEVERVADRVAIMRSGRIEITDTLLELKESICEVTITLSDPLVALPYLDEASVLSEQVEGRQRRWVVRNFSDSNRVELESVPGVLSVRSQPATLDEMFIAATRGTSALEVSHKGSSRKASEMPNIIRTAESAS
jgi:ABC-2 type transport system ATP-binding protein